MKTLPGWSAPRGPAPPRRDDPTAVTVDEVRAAAERIAPHVIHTPLSDSAWLTSHAGCPVYVKWESLQRTGSFKLRGAINKLLLLRERGVEEVLAVSAGNHGLGVAWAARRLGMRATVVVPESAAPTKVEAIRRQGATLLALGRDYDEAEAAARRLSTARGLPFASPYNDAEVIAGQGTVALELFDELPERPAVVLCPVGGGGLLAGVAIVAHAVAPGVPVFGCQPEGATAMHEALRAGRIVPVFDRPSCADGLSGNLEAGSITVPLVAALAAGVELVSEDSIERAIRGFLAHDHLVVEGSGAVGAAALLEGRFRARGPIALLATGRNIDLARLEAILARTG